MAKKAPKKTSKKKSAKKKSPEKKEIPKEEKSKKRKVNWVLTLIMSVFFGHLGVDRFIIRHVGLGILKLITFGGLGIWWLVDIILIATKHEFHEVEWVEN